MLQREQPRSQPDRKSGGRLGDGPFANREFGRVPGPPATPVPGPSRFVANSRNNQGRVDVEH